MLSHRGAKSHEERNAQNFRKPKESIQYRSKNAELSDSNKQASKMVSNNDLSTADNIVAAAIDGSHQLEEMMAAKDRDQHSPSSRKSSLDSKTIQDEAEWTSNVGSGDADPSLRRREEQAEGDVDIASAKRIVSTAVREGKSVRRHLRAEQLRRDADEEAHHAEARQIGEAKLALAEADGIVGRAVRSSVALESAMWQRDRRSSARPGPVGTSDAFAAADGIVSTAVQSNQADESAMQTREQRRRAREELARATILSRLHNASASLAPRAPDADAVRLGAPTSAPASSSPLPAHVQGGRAGGAALVVQPAAAASAGADLPQASPGSGLEPFAPPYAIPRPPPPVAAAPAPALPPNADLIAGEEVVESATSALASATANAAKK